MKILFPPHPTPYFQVSGQEPDCKIELSSKPQDYLVSFGYNPVHGVHPITQAIQRELNNAIA